MSSNSAETDTLRALLQSERELRENLDGYLRSYAGAYETVRKKNQELVEAIHQAIEGLQIGEPEVALAVLAEAVT